MILKSVFGKSRIKYLFLALLLLPATYAFSQKLGPINTDRPDQSTGVYTLPQKMFQIETGFLYGNDGTGRYLLHNTMLRYGLLTGTEVRLEFDYGHQLGATGVLPVNLSLKQAIGKQHGVLPAFGIVGNVSLPFLSSSKFRPNKVPAGLTLLFENELSDHFSLAYNVGTFLDGERDRLNWFVTGEIGYSPEEKLSFFLEYYANYANGTGPDHNADAGVLYLLKNNMQVDLAAGTSLFRKSMKNQFATVGWSYRFSK